MRLIKLSTSAWKDIEDAINLGFLLCYFRPNRTGLSTIDRDFGIFNKIHHNIETHVVHHLFPTIPHYNLVEATEAAKSVLGKHTFSLACNSLLL